MPLNWDLTDRNRIQGRRGGVSGQRTATPSSHSDTHAGKSGGDPVKHPQLTLGDLSICRAMPTTDSATGGEESREVSRGHSSPFGRRAEPEDARSRLGRLDGGVTTANRGCDASAPAVAVTAEPELPGSRSCLSLRRLNCNEPWAALLSDTSSGTAGYVSTSGGVGGRGE